MTQDDRKDFKKWIVDLAFEAQQGLCSKCGVSLEVEPFQIHHKDGNHSNNELSNCELLCVKCHHKTFPTVLAGGIEGDAYEAHRIQEMHVLTSLNTIIQQATDPASKMSGATLEKLIEGLTLSLKVSRNATDVDYGMMKTPAYIKLERGFAETQAQSNSYLEGYMDATKQLVSKLGQPKESS